MKKLFSLFLVIAVAAYIWQLKNNMTAFSNMLEEQFAISQKHKTALRIDRNLAQVEFPASDNRSPLEIARELISDKKTEWNLQPYHEMRAEEVSTPIGTRVTYSFFQDNLPLQGQSIQIIVSKRGKILSIENNYKPLERAEIQGVDFSEVIARLKDKFEVTDADKIHDPVLYPVPGLNKPELAYPLTIKSAKGPEKEVLVRASDGEILLKTPARKEF